MTLRGIFQTFSLIILVVVTVGCDMGYNGAFSSRMDRRSRLAYEEFMRQQRELAQQNRYLVPSQHEQLVANTASYQPRTPNPRRSQGVQFGGATHPQINAPSNNRIGQFTANHTERSTVTVGPLGLFGQLPSVNSQQDSPLDSPDNLRQITFATEGADFDPDVDPTGTMLVYASTQHRATADLYLKKINGTALQQLTDDPGNDVMPAFSEDGQRIAFASDRAGNWDIYMMDTTGGQAVQLTNDLTHDLSPSFSPDGKQLVYCTYGAQSGQWELVVVDVDNPATKRFIGYGLFPDWSPADNRILFQRARERGTRWFSIWTVELVNGEGLRPTEIAVSSNAATISPTWSPDAKHLAFSTIIDPDSEKQINPVQADIWILKADGSGRTNLTTSQFANLHPAWAKDGSIYFVSNRAKNGVENIWAIRPDRALEVTRPVLAPTTQPAAKGSEPEIHVGDEFDPLASNTDMLVPSQ